MSSHSALQKAKAAADDEWYTPPSAVAQWLAPFHDDLRGRRILCDCADYTPDGPRAFAAYLADHYHDLDLHGLTALEFHPAPDLFTLDSWTPGARWDYDGTAWRRTALSGTGGFDSDEAKRIRRGVDVVVSNPPFSLMRRYLATVARDGVDHITVAPLSALGLHAVVRAYEAGRLRPDAPSFANVDYGRPVGASTSCPPMTGIITSFTRTARARPLTLLPYRDGDWPRIDGHADWIEVKRPSAGLPDYPGVMVVSLTVLLYDLTGFHVAPRLGGYLYIDGRVLFRRILVSRSA